MLKLIDQHKVFGGSQCQYEHESQVLNCTMRFSLFLPEQAQEQPVSLLWWLSGLTCTDQNFSTKAGFQQFASQYGLAVAIPDTSPRGEDIADDEAYDLGQGAGFYLNATQDPWRDHYQMASYLSDELPPLVYSLIPQFTGKESIAGHSMGGYGALVSALRDENRFESVSAFAPISNPQNVPWGEKAFEAYLGANKDSWQEWDPLHLLTQVKKRVPILISQGDHDEFYPVQVGAEALLKLVDELDYPLFYHLEEGYDHSYYMIQTFIADHLAFHAQHLAE